jgi:o-succinylbenzoate synthase
MLELKKRIDVPLAADELIRTSADPMKVVETGAADVAIVKVQPMGGVARLLEFARRIEIPIVVSSALETSVGMYSGLLVASLLEKLPYACGLGTVSLLEGDSTPDPLVPYDGMVEVRRPEPSATQLRRWAPDRARATELLRKVRAAAEVLT